MNEDLHSHPASAEDRVASFARAANILAAFARAGAKVRPAAAIRARANTLAQALHALEVPARATPARSSAPGEDAIVPQERGVAAPRRGARPLAAVLADGSARPAPIARGHSERSRAADETAERRASSPRAAMTRALAAARSGSIAVGRVQQFTMRANLQSAAQDNGAESRDSAIFEGAIAPVPPRARDLNLVAMLAATSAARRAIAGGRRIAMAPEAPQKDPGYRDPSRPPAAVIAIAALPARIRRVLAGSRREPPPTDEYSLRADIGDPPRERAFAAHQGRRANGAAPITINSAPSITVNLPPGAAAPGERGISRAVEQALEEHAEKLYEMMRQVGAFRERTEF